MPSTSRELIDTYFDNGSQKSHTRFTKDWIRTPNYFSLPKKDLPVNAYTVETWETKCITPSYKHRWYWQNGGWDPASTQGPLGKYWPQMATDHAIGMDGAKNLHPSTSKVFNELIVKCLAGAADVKVNLPVAFAEASKTSNLILDRANRIYRAYKSFKRLQFRETARQLGLSSKTVHKTWLEYQYGWMPLLLETKGAAELLAQHHLGKPLRFEVVKSFTDSTTFRSKGKTYLKDEGAQLDITWESESTRRYHVMIEFEVTNQLLDATRQMGITDPLSVAWELTPFSFVFDWFVSVGDYLKALSAFQGLSIVRAAGGERTHVKGKCWTEPTKRQYLPGLFWDSTISSNVQEDNRNKYVRTPLTINPLSIYPPVSSDPFNWKRVINGVALLRASIR